jgi:hypothetical protein
MFLNYSTCKNEVIGKTDNGTLIMLYGHVKERYEERLQRVKEVTGVKELDFVYLMEKTLGILNEYYFECRSRNLRKIRHVIRGKIKLVIGKKHLILDVSILVAGSEVEFGKDYPFVVEEQYKHLVESGELMLHDTILAVETMNTTIRFADEPLENFSKQPEIARIKFPKDEYKIKDDELVYITEHMLADKNNKISKCVQMFIRKILRKRNIRL